LRGAFSRFRLEHLAAPGLLTLPGGLAAFALDFRLPGEMITKMRVRRLG
jgi:hypothetical protein